ncbi:hypothetical protein NA57DRAFT_78810 [Rhizodiscina lignyota]|uniref:Nucleotidyltransferase n=1 Tax=Rhizodiscina lignyota TaxID=1504668 RepID=A0A9P4M3S8_9PEZI|nr:hypothetical protein NA57DRAFT_78810 [Rhizodiscina lignyota]
MGGNAFASPGPGEPALSTPRMSTETYLKLRDQCIRTLSAFYHEVSSCIEAPGKLDHGDIDILVSRPRRENITGEAIKEALGAVCAIPPHKFHHYAVPLPDGKGNQYAQVDVHECREGYLPWELVMQSYGDLWQIVGKFLRRAGLTATDKGLHVRIPEIEDAGQKNLAMVYLSHDPSAILSFLGLDEAKWKEGFATADELYEWCCQGRFFGPESFERAVENANDRQRMAKRKMFSDFTKDWLVNHRARVWPDERRRWTRAQVLHEALGYFGKHIYDEKMRDWRSEHEEKELWERLAAEIPEEGDRLKAVRRALRRWTRFENGGPQLSDEAILEEPLRKWVLETSHADEENLSQYVRTSWEEAKRREREREKIAKTEREAKRPRLD